MHQPFDSVLLLAYGAPERMEDVRPFLDNVLRGLPVPKERYEVVVHHYELIGGKSPLNELTDRQARGLRSALRDEGLDLGVYVGMRFARPYIFTAIRDMVRDGRRRAVAIVLAPYRSEPSWEKYREAVAEVLDAADPGVAPGVEWVEPWYDHPLFAEAQADRVRQALESLTAERRHAARLLFTAHSIPTAVAERCPYRSQIEATCRNVAEALGGHGWELAWQSRSGNPRTPWLEPDVNARLGGLKSEGVRDVVLCPIGFISDHVEVMYDLDLEAAQTCRGLGLGMARAGTVNDHPAFLRALADLVKRKVAERGEPAGGANGRSSRPCHVREDMATFTAAMPPVGRPAGRSRRGVATSREDHGGGSGRERPGGHRRGRARGPGGGAPDRHARFERSAAGRAGRPRRKGPRRGGRLDRPRGRVRARRRGRLVHHE